MRGSLFVGAVFAAAMVLPGVAQAQAITATTTADLNLRAGPGPQFPVITAMPANTAVEVTGCLDDRNWCEVVWNNTRGWSYSAYLTAETAGQVVVLQQAPTPPPVVVFPGEEYWVQHYETQPFFAERERFFGPGAGAAGGAAVGLALGGPIGAAIGAGVGAIVGEAVTPPAEVVDFVVAQQPTPVYLQGEVVLGATVPPDVVLTPIPNYDLQLAYINEQRVLVHPTTRQIQFIYRP